MELIVFDLDGTLLNNASEISAFTRDTLAKLAERDIAYTVATGRTLHSGQELIAGHGFNLPHIYNNGVIIWDPRNQSLMLDNCLSVAESQQILEATFTQKVTPFVSVINEHHQHFIYHPPVRNDSEARLLTHYLTRPSVTVLPLEDIPQHAIITNISMLGYTEDINSIQLAINNEAHLIAYSGPAIEGNGLKWMDIHHNEANKGGAINLLKQQLGVKKIICFGDNDNDLSMFATADESYAPINANEKVKSAATAIIGHHDADGIAHFLRERFNL